MQKGVDSLKFCYNPQSMRNLIPLILALCLTACSNGTRSWYFDTVATDDRPAGRARLVVETVWGRTEANLDDGILYVGPDAEFIKAIWGADDAKEDEHPETDPGLGEGGPEPAEKEPAETEIAGEPAENPE